jgi:hypothetical protein
MTDKPVSPLRQRMIEDMTVRLFKEKVQKDSIRYVQNFKDFLGRSPDTATSEDLRLFRLHMTRNHVGAPSILSHSRRQPTPAPASGPGWPPPHRRAASADAARSAWRRDRGR